MSQTFSHHLVTLGPAPPSLQQSVNQEQTRLLSQAIASLSLADSIIFRIGSKIVGWKKVKP